MLIHVDSEDSDQIGQTGHFVGFVMRRLNLFCYTPPHKKWQGIMLYPPNFECLSVRPSVHQHFVSVL